MVPSSDKRQFERARSPQRCQSALSVVSRAAKAKQPNVMKEKGAITLQQFISLQKDHHDPM
jgi:hypothetical protein